MPGRRCPRHSGNFGRKEIMFDFHMHSHVSFDSKELPENMVKAALDKGLKEICFTDHIDYDPFAEEQIMVFDTEKYNAAYDQLYARGLKVRRGMEFGMAPDNREQFRKDLQRRHFDFVLGSVHFVDGLDVYFKTYWEGKTIQQAIDRYFRNTLECVQVHEDFDVLAHMTFICKSPVFENAKPAYYRDWREIVDEVLKILVQKGKGLELNTSGVDRCGGFLPTEDFFRRFQELGGEIVTVGSDAHTADRVGQYTDRACEILKDIFGHVCTFEDRKPIFHKL